MLRLQTRRVNLGVLLGVLGLPAGRAQTMKYDLLSGDTVQQDGRTLYRVRRIADGLLGGYIESQANLAQEGSCFLYDRSRAFGNARICDDASVYGIVYDDAIVADQAKAYGEIFGHAQILGQAVVRGRVYDRAVVKDFAEVYGQAYGHAVVEDHAVVYGQIFGTAVATGHEVVYGIKSH